MIKLKHKKLNVWNLTMTLTTLIYELTKGFPQDELYGLTSQLRRAAVSVPSNIAEGAARSSKKKDVDSMRLLVHHSLKLILN